MKLVVSKNNLGSQVLYLVLALLKNGVYVIIATGHLGIPHSPKFVGEETFPGRVGK